nr:DUF6717 family protein [Pedobacter panaciterrae]
METYRGELFNHEMWLCQVTVDVFYKLPKAIYIGYINAL